MKTPCKKYTSEEISRFIDHELALDRYEELARHHVNCPDCNSLVERFKSISIVFNNHADKAVSKINTEKLRQKTEQALENAKKASLKTDHGFFGKNIYLKLASIAAILTISLFWFHGSLFGPTGPSAIVTSVDTNVASVMIIETQTKKHTIIWFSET
ncbi:zf-HC2 domain-containing protein [Desulfobacula toluolica]|uniref:Conserved uncharacterized protein n=1 Tax=Desulfobacula toluolica (strain DSM 7467 / Tol2) TaxID=651182 RepID=K0NE26_DESTT|nr:zf-HC2 domain-containing protein [Desulfobacula toluolica]CCK79231.1 conserved uncharacterized protein [Desulfobacula toluolica Tol2]